MSRFNDLVNLYETDRTNTYEYVSSITLFAAIVRQKIIDYLGCEAQQVYFLKPDGTQGTQHGTALIGGNGFFNYRLLARLSDHGFNTNECGHDFFKKMLVPPSGIALVIGIKKEDGMFKIKAPSITDNRVITVEFVIEETGDIGNSPSWQSFQEACFQTLKHIASQNLSDRMRNNLETVDDESDRAFGFKI